MAKVPLPKDARGIAARAECLSQCRLISADAAGGVRKENAGAFPRAIHATTNWQSPS